MRGFKKLRKQNNWTQPQLATKANVSSQVVSNWERGYTPPSPDDIAKLSEIFDVRSDFILLGKLDSPLPSNKGTSFSRPKILDGLVELTLEELTVFQELKNTPSSSTTLLPIHQRSRSHKDVGVYEIKN